ncbi:MULTISPECIES: FAD-binding oxidoreductase [unclassified Rhizobium]|jgi:FAD/FMN-containing dehydrogenase|uniref:FAD-binding oxidoreductase n=1 Tax=unclassified Rhizobium TaxID=2613769 RepID=UPI000647D7DE|nr:MULTISPECIES: FAD-binding oxidoreductase [unclassified Rhizobium]MBN8950648.1 FAD-binding oxidoreductase [Rhizobium tropici]OJY66188.1 MAG: FAD-binding oxidoreductase [Rhizobium sp. 60-20]RKD69252.1 FAD/FMN-containing dehydrogenase [Rhizobium sp. WW_1]
MNAQSPLKERALAALSAAMPTDLLLTDAEALERYSRDWSGDHYGRPLAVARPRSTEELSYFMACCHELGMHVVPQGGLTGLVGAAVASFPEGEVVVSLERMNKVRSVNPIDFAMVVEAGCILEDAKRHAEAADCILPITFGAQGSCRIGGNVSTNAGGFNVLRYGMTRDLVLGLEVVLADGRIWNGLRTLRKDNRGYDLKQLFIGAEGTLGIVAAAALKVFPKPEQVETALVGLESVEAAMQLYARARRQCSDLLTAFELILRGGIEIAINAREDLNDPLSQSYPVYVLIEASAAGRVDLKALLEGFFADASDLVLDGVIASSKAQGERLWLLREMMVEAQGRGGRYLRTDVSVSISSIAAFVSETLAALADKYPEAIAVTYGHVGDGNIHLNIVPPEDMPAEEYDSLFHATEEVIFDVVDRHGGSISAEHGIGKIKQAAFLKRADPLTLELARRIKDAFDPEHLLSEGRILASAQGKAGG